MFSGTSGPAHASGTMWSTSHPGHGPAVLPFAGQGCVLRNAAFAAAERLMRFELVGAGGFEGLARFGELALAG